MRQKVPQPNRLPFLPPPQDQIESIRVLKQLSRSSSALGELKGIANTIPNQTMLVNAIVLREAKDSSEIENIITSQDELYKALSSKSTHTPEAKEVINYRKAIFKGFDIIKDQGFLRLADIIELQGIVIENNAGIRSTPGTVLKNDKTGEVVYVPPQDKAEILDLLSNFLDHFNLNEHGIPPLVNLAILHCQFESIHPFYDGNGRTGRILNILYLILNDLMDLPILYLSSYIIDNKDKYYGLLNAVNKSGNWEEWILYMLYAVEETSKKTIQKINLIKNALDETIIEVSNKAAKLYRKELVELLFEQPYSKIEYVVEKLGVERKAASRYLKKLSELGVLENQKIGRENIYVNTKLIEILKKY
ncbi:MAG: Fic family protein [Bacteroidota bacterium]